MHKGSRGRTSSSVLQTIKISLKQAMIEVLEVLKNMFLRHSILSFLQTSLALITSTLRPSKRNSFIQLKARKTFKIYDYCRMNSKQSFY